MNCGRAIVAAVATWLLGFADLHGEESDAEILLVGRGAAAVSVQVGEAQTGNALVRRSNGVWRGEWAAAADCTVRLEVVRGRHPAGIHDIELLALRVILTNRSTEPRTVPVVLRIAPSSSTLRDLVFERHAFFFEGQPILAADTPSRGALLADSAFALRPLTPGDVGHVTSTSGECRGELFFDLMLAPGQSQTLGFFSPGPRATSPEVAVTLELLRSLRIDEFFPAAAAP